MVHLMMSSDITEQSEQPTFLVTAQQQTRCVVIVYSVSLASFISPGELCVNPPAVISDNSITPVEEFDLAPIRTQIPGQRRRAE